MAKKKPNTKKEGHSELSEESKPKESEIKTITFADIEDIRMIVIVKGKAHLLVARPEFLNQSKIDMECALRLALDSHIIMDESIDELEDKLRGTLKEIGENKK